MADLLPPWPCVRKSAEVSECGRYRWWLRRSWSDLGTGVVTFIMLNPSTADADVDDNTIRRCVGFARAWGYGAVAVRNLFPFRSTEPEGLLLAADPAGGQRGDSELLACRSANAVVAAWGAWVPFGRDAEVLELLAGVPLKCLGLTKAGRPRHPLYVKGSTQLVPFTAGVPS